MSARLAGQIVKPKDWPAFQRNCVVLFREELRDPNTKEYGRNGQDQGGIDILGCRNGDPDHAVGIQCRKIEKSLKQSAILKDCRAALELEFGLREIIFATTAANDTKADQAAKAVERLLRSEGYDLTVHVYGWEQLETLIGIHEPAYNAFMPMAVATSRQLDLNSAPSDLSGLAAIVADEVARRMGGSVLAAPPAPGGPDGIGSESPTLHAKIDLLRDLVCDGDVRAAEQRLVALRDSPGAADAPWARYRIETNIAAALMDRGCEAEAAEAYERAIAIRPDDPNALANLALARTIQGRPDEGMRIATELLNRADRTEFAVSALLQAAVRSDWQGDPESLVPADMIGSFAATFAVADFMRRRWLPGWEQKVLALPDREENQADLGRLKGLAILSIAVDSRVHVVGGKDTVSDDQIDWAATQVLACARHCLQIGYAYRHDLMAHVSNAGLLLRLADRLDEAEAVLRDGLRVMPGEEQLMRLLAMTLLETNRRDEAVQVLSPGSEPETVMMKVQFGRTATAAERLEMLRRMDQQMDERVAGMRRRLMAELAIASDDDIAAMEVISDMRAHRDDLIAAELLDLQRERKKGLDVETAKERLRTVALNLDPETNPIDRFLVAEAMLQNGLESAAADIIEDHIDLESPRPATFLYLSALAEARRDDAYHEALLHASAEVRENPDMLWLDARHAWNAGDLDRSLRCMERFLELKPDEPRAVLMRIEVLLRMGRSKQVLEALEKPIEGFKWGSGNEPFRIAALLSHFGHHERAARLSYRLFSEQRDKPRAWMSLSSMTIREGQELRAGDFEMSPLVVGNDVAVDLEFDDGTKTFFIVEPDKHLRELDVESWEPDHSLAKAVLGLSAGERFVGPDGREGRIAQLRHKIVARFHYVLANYEKRFPEVFGFKSLTIDPERSDGLDELIAQLKERHEWVIAEQDEWQASGHPLDVLAARIGVDTIDVAGGLAQQGIKLRVAEGTEAERFAADASIRGNMRHGCVLDLATFWTAWRLGVLDHVDTICGAVSVPRSVVDRLQAKRERAEPSQGGRGTLSYLDGKILHTEASPEQMNAAVDDLDAALRWIEEHDAAKPIVLTDALPDALRELLQSGRTDMLDAIALALTSSRILVCDDLALRTIHNKFGSTGSAWLHHVLARAHIAKRIGGRVFTQQTVDMLNAGQSYLSVTGGMIAVGIEMDVLETGGLAHRSAALIERLGGAVAEPISHVVAACEAFEQLWSTQSVKTVREKATGVILEKMIRQREDWRQMLAAIDMSARQFPDVREYLRDWAKGHFLPGFA